ncbi:RNA polymerase sigma factor [Flavobacterium pallidum]|uniref:RNA polymerase subunit sigma n=1 Tax=Flavobacterium pallidum TaxID=2172098 RepID=A0A2S1SE27_9FLAO|nr:sigma-70 family RNA polymerase sigma factor [Flavobacterium pallidum]AWI24634.1 RNA polymerase subunit sigma [Flavobacterium pallidum]
MEETNLIPHLFRTEYRKIVSVLCTSFGIQHIEIAEDIVSDTFLAASELWGLKGLPPNPAAWLYTVAKNKTKNYLKRDAFFAQKLAVEIRHNAGSSEEIDIDLSEKSIADSQLAMIFTVCNPCIPAEAQVALALNLLCGFGTQEIADAFLTNNDTIYKRLARAKEKLKSEQVKIEHPSQEAVSERLEMVLRTLYLLFNEGYYSGSQKTIIREDLCAEAMRLNYLLVENERTDSPSANALLSLMCFHASRFKARTNENGETILYDDQDTNLWDYGLIDKGVYFMDRAFRGEKLSKYHLEAGIAYWHTQKEDNAGKWENILQLYNQLLIIEYSPIAALNRTFALAKANGSRQAIMEAEKLQLTSNPFWYSLLGHLYSEVNLPKAIDHYQKALALAHSEAERITIRKKLSALG